MLYKWLLVLFSLVHWKVYMWAQQNKDWHGCINSINVTAVEKADNKIKALYKKIDLVLHYKHKKYFTITLKQHLQ